MTKLARLLDERDMSQRDLYEAIIRKFGIEIGRDRISKLYTGSHTNPNVNTVKIIAQTLRVRIDDIVE
jgi:transcriptional regulator with XRE-family HTH domain